MKKLNLLRRKKANINVFISYSHLDYGIVLPLAKIIRISENSVFVDKESINPGENWEESILLAIQNCQKLILFWSQYSAFSEFIAIEYKTALLYNKPIIPILLDSTPLPVELSHIQHLDIKDLIKSAEIRANAVVPVVPLIMFFSPRIYKLTDNVIANFRLQYENTIKLAKPD